MKPPEIKLAKTESLVLRACRSDLTSRNGFKWKSRGIVTVPDWRPNKECGHGLHGWLHGVGRPDVWEHCNNDIWLVLAVKTKDLIDLEGKVKFPSCRVLFAGSREVATALAISHCPGAKVNYGTATAGNYGAATAGNEGTATAGYRGTATAGYKGTASAGDEGTATAGYKGTATAGDEGTASAGDEGTATAGYKGTATAGYKGTASAGDEGTATAGNEGTASAGDEGTATAGNYGTATAGNYGTATAGDKGTASAGDEGTVIIKYWSYKANRHRLMIGYVGENGLEAGKKYKLNEQAQFIEAE